MWMGLLLPGSLLKSPSSSSVSGMGGRGGGGPFTTSCGSGGRGGGADIWPPPPSSRGSGGIGGGWYDWWSASTGIWNCDAWCLNRRTQGDFFSSLFRFFLLPRLGGGGGKFWIFFQHCFICRPPDSTVSVSSCALAVTRSSLSVFHCDLRVI